MRKMKKAFCYLLALCMMVSLMPVKVQAEDNGLMLGDFQSGEDFWSAEDAPESWLEEDEWGISDFEVGSLTYAMSTYDTRAESTVPVSEILVNNQDAIANPTGDGWSFDVEKGVLTLDGASFNAGEASYGIFASGDLTIVAEENTENFISGGFAIGVQGNLTITGGTINANSIVPQYIHGVYATGNITIVDCEEVNVSGHLGGIVADGMITIQNSKVNAEATLEVMDALAVGTPQPPCGILAPYVQITENSDVISTADFVGVYGGEVQILNSNIDAEGLFHGVYSASPMNVENSSVIAKAYASLEDVYTIGYPMVVAFGGPGLELSITDSEIHATSVIAGVLVDGLVQEGTGNLNIANSIIDVEAGYIGVGAVSGIELTDSTINADITMSVEEALEYMGWSGITAPASGMFMLSSSGAMNMNTSEIEINGGWCGIGADIVDMNYTSIKVTGGAYGIMGGQSVTLTDCEKTVIKNDSEMIDAFFALGGLTATIPASVIATGPVTIQSCDELYVEGSFVGIGSGVNQLTIVDSSVNSSGGAYGVVGDIVVIFNSDIQADAIWTDEESLNHNLATAIAVAATNALEIANCKITNGGVAQYYDKEINGIPVFGYTVVDNDLPAKSVTMVATNGENPEPIPPAEIAGGTCGNSVNWILDANGKISVFAVTSSTFSRRAAVVSEESYVMDDYASPEDAPWHEYRDQIVEVIIDALVSNVGNNSFSGCANLQNVEIGNGVKVIGSNAFEECTNLQKVVVGESVETIEDNAFSNCAEVKVDFNGNQPVVSDTAFAGTVTEITYSAENETWKDTTQNNYGDSSIMAPQKPSDGTEGTDDPCADGHEMGEWYVVNEATCESDGLKRQDCANCDAYSTEKIKKAEHEYSDGVCGNCGEEDSDYVPPVEPEEPVDPDEPVKPGKPSIIDKVKDFVSTVLDKLFGKNDDSEKPGVPEKPEEPEKPDKPVKPNKPVYSNPIGKIIGKIIKIIFRR